MSAAYFARFLAAVFFPGHPASMSAYASRETVLAALGRLFPALFRRLMFATSEFFGAALFFAGAFRFARAAAGAFFCSAAGLFLTAAAPLCGRFVLLAVAFRAELVRFDVFLAAIPGPMCVARFRRSRADAPRLAMSSAWSAATRANHVASFDAEHLVKPGPT